MKRVLKQIEAKKYYDTGYMNLDVDGTKFKNIFEQK